MFSRPAQLSTQERSYSLPQRWAPLAERFPRAAHRAGALEDPFVTAIPSCHSTWVFDQLRLRYRQISLTLNAARETSTEWRPYDHLRIDAPNNGIFVFANASGTTMRWFKSHLRPCLLCGTEGIEGADVVALSRLIEPQSKVRGTESRSPGAEIDG